MSVLEIIVNNLKKLMKEKNISIDYLSFLLETDVKTINKYLNLELVISSDKLHVLCDIYNILIQYFLGIEEMLEEVYTIKALKQLYFSDSISINRISEILKINNIETRQIIKEWNKE